MTFIGVDVSKDMLDVAVYGEPKAFRFAQTEEGLAEFLSFVADLKPRLVVFEATGGYEMAAVAVLVSDGLPAAVVNPRRTRDFARAMGLEAKTDRIDAAVLAEYAAKMVERIRVSTLPDDDARALRELLLRRRQLVTHLASERNRQLQLVGPRKVKRVVSSVARAITFLEKEIAELDKEMNDHIQNSDIWKRKDELLQSVPGVGPTTARTMLTVIPELGTLTNKEVAALVGVAPYNDDSGPPLKKGKVRPRHIRGGRAEARNVLYMAVMTAIRCNPVIRAFYERLVANGKKGLVAMTACIRKLAVILNAMLRDNVAWTAAATLTVS